MSSGATASVQELLGSEVLVKNPDDGTTSTASISTLEGKHIGLLFSRPFIPSCHRFLPKLQQAYESLKKRGKDFEVVFINQEATREGFDDYYGAEMPWAALPFGSPNVEKLVNTFCTSKDALPVLVMLDPQGHVLSKNAKLSVTVHPKEFPWVQRAPPSVTDSAIAKIKPYALPLFMMLMLGYRMYFQEHGAWVYERFFETPLLTLLESSQPYFAALQPYIEALQVHVEAVKKYLARLYYQR